MSSYIKSTIIIALLLFSCEKQSINLDSSSISTSIEFKKLAIDLDNTSTFQLDSDSLPDYKILDPLLKDLVENRKSSEELVRSGYDKELVNHVKHSCSYT